MGIFDDWRRRDRKEPTGSDSLKVPKGHQIRLFPNPVEPDVFHTAGFLVASFGFGGDDPIAEVEAVFTKVEDARAGGLKPILLVADSGPISGLCAPGNPRVGQVQGGVIWTVRDGGLDGWTEDPKRIQSLLRRFHRARVALGDAVAQVFYLSSDDWLSNGEWWVRTKVGMEQRPAPIDHSQADGALARLLEGVGIPVRRPEPDGTVLVEVKRPEGVVLSGLAGSPFGRDKVQPDTYPRDVNREKDRAEAAGDQERLRRLELEELDFLTERLGTCPPPDPKKPLMRAPRLRRLLLSVVESKGDGSARRALYEELLSRESPLLLLSGLEGQVAPMKWPGFTALPAFPDLQCLYSAAEDLRRTPGTFAIALMMPRELFAWARKINSDVALNVYRDHRSPHYLPLKTEALQALLDGTIPSS